MDQLTLSKSSGKPHPLQKATIQRKNNQKLIWIAAALFMLILICICGALIGGFFFKERLLALFQGKADIGLVLNPRSEDGSISGKYRIPGTASAQNITFSVSHDGYAIFETDGESETLIVDNRQDPVTTMQWNGVLFDGMGGLSGEEQEAMTSLSESDILEGIFMIPLDAACLGDEQISPEQVAALLIPMQMHLKYNQPDRWKLVNDLLSHSACNYSEEGQNFTTSSPVIYLSPADPVPVVPGYFPFDAEGAVELQAGNTSGDKLACANPLVSQNISSNSTGFYTLDVFGSDPILDETGPCNARCRGACGPDCTHDNCIFRIEERCEKNQEGDNNGFFSLINVYDCGLHPACVEHDACYDDCNTRHGCGSWAAAFCMHGMTLVSAPVEYFSDSYLSCDSATLVTENPSDVKDWVRGFGPQPFRQIYEYHNKDLRYEYDPVTCPLKEDADQPDPGTKEDTGDKPQNPVGTTNNEPIDPCLIVPAGGTVLGQTSNVCDLRYGSSTPVMLVWVKVYDEQPDMAWSCETLPSRKGAYIEEELVMGECGYRLRYQSVNADYNFSNPTAWGISFLLDRFEVDVLTEGWLDENTEWVFNTAGFIEDQIILYLNGVDE